MPETPARAAAPTDGAGAVSPAAPDLLRTALADARSPRVPELSPYVPERPFPWSGPALPLSGSGSGTGAEGGVRSRAVVGAVSELEFEAGPDPKRGTDPAPDPATTSISRPGPAIDLDRVLRLSLAAPAGTPGGRLRPVPSAGALHPVRAHLLIGQGCSMPPGRYAYDPRTHRAHPRGPAPDGVPPGALVVLAVAASRTVAHYGHRAWPLLLLDTGHAAAALALAGATTADVLVSLDADGSFLSTAAGLPDAPDWQDAWPGTEPELPLAAVRLTPPGRPVDAAPPLSAWAALPLPLASAPTPQPGADTTPPRELAVARHLLHDLAGAPGRPDGTWHPAPCPGQVTDEALESRRSAPPEDLNHPPGKDLLARILATAQGVRPDGPAWTVAVGGADPALYAAGPGKRGLDVRAEGDARTTLAHWAAGQQWIGAAGAVLLAHGCPEGAARATVRSSHLVAGYAAGVAQALATALGLRSRPIGSWQQADLGAALGDTPGREWIVHGLALGALPTPTAAPAKTAATSAPTPATSRLTPTAAPATPPAASAPTPVTPPTASAAPAAPPGEEERP
ncbi:nitroreductase [Streptomyces sp. PTY087I2]|uniref:nitroreductase n=1 Tax=Streptomyces sp. PTY087I2 TaxID=1819298 RepID=UPI000827D897|nr:nitroreductase [Streptomyces sp. PTY087I2]OCC13731.1 Nitroreductase family protein [Streptomyces sp. PTY087I2]